MDTRDHQGGLRCQQDTRREDGQDMATVPSRVARIGTKGRFCFMELPVELRLKIYNYLLICPETINIPPPSETPTSEIYPSTTILQTCKTVNEEGTPILYSTNTFNITLPLERRRSLKNPLTDTPPSFQFSHLRWSTLASMTSLSFQSNNEVMVLDLAISPACRPVFACSGKDIMSRFRASEIMYSPIGPDEYMGVSISSWISTKVMMAELTAFQLELEVMMKGDVELIEGGVIGGGDEGAGTGTDGNGGEAGAGASTSGET